jgi:hypothetical protein
MVGGDVRRFNLFLNLSFKVLLISQSTSHIALLGNMSNRKTVGILGKPSRLCVIIRL